MALPVAVDDDLGLNPALYHALFVVVHVSVAAGLVVGVGVDAAALAASEVLANLAEELCGLMGLSLIVVDVLSSD